MRACLARFHHVTFFRQFAAVLAVILVAAFSNDAVMAQTIFRCGSTYSRVQCPGGYPLEVGDPRTAAQRSEARRIANEVRRQSTAMERERLRSEAALEPAAAGSLTAASAPAPTKPTMKAKKRVKKKHAAPPKPAANEDFVARVPTAGKKSKSTASDAADAAHVDK